MQRSNLRPDQDIQNARKNAARNTMSNTVAHKTTRGRSTLANPPSLYGADGGRKYLNRTERKRVLDGVDALPADKALFVLTLAWTGARVSEVLALTGSSFQIEAGIVSIVTLKRRRLTVREVPIPTPLMLALDAQFRLRGAQADPDLAASRVWPWHRVTAWRIIKKMMIRLSMTGRPACPRGFRHGFGVNALQAGVPLNILQRWLGHARISTTAIYADASGPEERELAKRFWIGT